MNNQLLQVTKVSESMATKVSYLDREPEPDSCWYFAIASMMNPVSLSERNLTPVESVASELLDHRLHFGQFGMAEAVSAEGDSFHGVLHKMAGGQMERLDELETMALTRCTASARLYTGEVVSCTVYKGDEKKKAVGGQDGTGSLPPQRYVQIMTEGARHFGVAPEYIAKLEALEVVPRVPAAQFSVFPVPTAGVPSWSFKDVQAGDASSLDTPMYTHLNGKVLEWTGSRVDGVGVFLKRSAGQDTTFGFAKGKYDPVYGTVTSYSDMTDEHRASIEHALAVVPDLAKGFKVVATVSRRSYLQHVDMERARKWSQTGTPRVNWHQQHKNALFHNGAKDRFGHPQLYYADRQPPQNDGPSISGSFEYRNALFHNGYLDEAGLPLLYYGWMQDLPPLMRVVDGGTHLMAGHGSGAGASDNSSCAADMNSY